MKNTQAKQLNDSRRQNAEMADLMSAMPPSQTDTVAKIVKIYDSIRRVSDASEERYHSAVSIGTEQSISADSTSRRRRV